MFKYYLYFTFHCFTQYYENFKMFYALIQHISEFLIFLCARIKMGGVKEMILMQFMHQFPLFRIDCSA